MEFATGALGSLLPKLGQLLRDEYNLQRSVRKDVQFLVRELESMSAALRKVGEVPPEELDELVRNWARDVRELSYDMEDVVDTFLVRVDGGHDQPHAETFKRLIKKMMDVLTKGTIRHQIAREIESIKERVKEVAERRDRYNIFTINTSTTTMDISTINTVTTMMDPLVTALYTKASDLVGIDKARDDLISKLTKGHNISTQQQKIVSIVGFGGLGKTTLAKAVYDKIKKQFECTAFVSVSRNPDIKKVIEDILYELDKNMHGNIHTAKKDERQLIDQLREFLQKKRYLVVVDDIWAIQPWKRISCGLYDNNMGSRIIVTTRNIDVAEKVGGSYKLEPLTHDSSKMLFYGRIFGSEKQCPAEFFEVSEKILKKCGGVPLAIITIASLLASNSKNISDWYELCGSIGSGIGNDPNMNDMRKILSLSYYDLPSHLKNCLLYLSIFPEDCLIKMDRLVLRWIAEGFVQHGKRGGTLSGIGESYFNELINRSMIQMVEDDYGIYCRVHDMVLDLICSLAREQNFVTLSDDIEQNSCLQKFRRISLHNATRAATHMPEVRSLTIFDPAFNSMPSLSCCQVLRVLDLEGCDLRRSGPPNLRCVRNLVQLRYLGLRDTRFYGELPADIGNLRFLQTLDMAGSGVRELPESVVKLGRLICLRVDYYTRLPSGIGKLTSLEELSGASTHDSSDIVKELRSLTELRVLRITLFELSQRVEEALAESLSNLRNVRVLDINVAGRVDYDQPHKLDSLSLVPPQQLREFHGCHLLLPAWLDAPTAPQLAVLVLNVRALRQADVDTLGRLPALRVLSLESDSTRELLTVGAGVFPLLVVCRLPDWSSVLEFRQGAMPLLRSLEFGFRVRNIIDLGRGGFEFGLEHLGRLEEAIVHVNLAEAWEEEAHAALEALRRAEDTHPNRTTFDVTLYGEEQQLFHDDE